jgi:hypothetical protein
MAKRALQLRRLAASEAAPAATAVDHCRSLSALFPMSSRSFPAAPGMIVSNDMRRVFGGAVGAVLTLIARPPTWRRKLPATLRP